MRKSRAKMVRRVLGLRPDGSAVAVMYFNEADLAGPQKASDWLLASGLAVSVETERMHAPRGVGLWFDNCDRLYLNRSK